MARCITNKKYYGVLVALVTYCAMAHLMSSFRNTKSSCDFYGSEGVIEETCTKYKSNLVGGSLCADLCDRKSIVYKDCINHRLGRSVLYMDYFRSGKKTKPETIVLKVQRYPDDSGSLVNDVSPSALEAADDTFLKTLERNISMALSQQLGNMFDSKLNKTILSDLWGYDVVKHIHSYENKSLALRSAYRSLWLLAQQREYVLMQLHQHVKAVPRMYGTCGAAFFMEYANSIASLKTGFSTIGRGTSLHLGDWKPRAKYALKILDALPDLDTKFRQSLHLCDAKDPNIGMRGEDDISLIDLDHGLMTSELHDRFQSQWCADDMECGFLKCPGLCNTTVNKCRPLRTNNNLQSICETVFLEKIGWVDTGLLRSPPPAIAQELMELIHTCAFPPSRISPTAHGHNWENRIMGYTSRVVHKPGDDIRRDLIRLIKKGLALGDT